MADKEYASIDINFNIVGADEVEGKLAKIEEVASRVDKVINSLSRASVRSKVDVEDKASEKVSNIHRKLSMLIGRTYVATISIKDKITGVVPKISDKIRSAFSLLTSPLGFVGMGAFAGGFGAMIRESLNVAGDLEQVNIAFSTMLRSEEKAKKFLAELQEFSIQTPFELPQLLVASRQLLAYGFKLEEVKGILKDVGDATAGLGLGAEGIARITLALGQIRAKGKLSGEEVRQLAEAGIPAWSYVARTLGITQQEAMKLSEKGLIPADKAIQAILKGMRTDFAGLMERQSRTLQGLLSTLRDFARLKIFGAFGEGLRQGLLPLLGKVVDFLSRNKKGAKDLEDTFMRFGRKVGDVIVKVLEKFYSLIQDITNPRFKGDLGDKVLGVFKNMLDKINAWLGGEGSEFLFRTFYNIGLIAGRAWVKALWNTITSGIGNLFKGNILGSLLSFGLFSFLGGGKLLGTAFKLGKWALGKITPVSVAEAATGTEVVTKITQAQALAGKISVPMLTKGMPIKAGIDIVRIIKARDKFKAGIGIAGEWGGMVGGAKLGAAIGTAIAPGIGSAIGGVVGGFIGMILGGKIGTVIVDIFKKIKWRELGGILREGFKRVAEFVPYGIGFIIGKIVRGVGDLIKLVGGLFFKIGEMGLKMLRRGWEGIQIFLRNPWGTLKDVVSAVWDTGIRIGTALIEGLWYGIKRVGGGLLGVLEKIFNFATKGAGNFLEGLRGGLGIQKNITTPKKIEPITKVKPYAGGGIVGAPTLALLGEKGAEVVIPLYDTERALSLWQWTGQKLHIKEFARGGIIGAYTLNYSNSVKEKKGLLVNIDRIDVKIEGNTKDINFDELANLIGKKITVQIKRALENRP